MAKQVLLYGEIFGLSSEMFLTEMEALKDEDIVLSMDTVGGNPEVTFGMIRKFQQHEGNKNIEVHARAYSMGAYFLCYADKNEALDVSDFILHRAAFPDWVESNEALFTPERRARTEEINNHLRNALEAKIDVDKFEKISKVTMDELFSMDGRIDVKLNAKQAKQIGLIDNINSITPEIQAKIQTHNGNAIQMAAKYVGDDIIAKEEVPQVNKVIIKNTNMDLSKLKAEHPALYAQVKQKGIDHGVAQERDRIGAWMAFADIDLKAVSEGIKGEKTLSATDMAELTRKGISAKVLGEVEGEAPEAVETPPTADKEELGAKTQVIAFEAKVKESMGMKTE